MPRHESDREDLLREATALVERVELSIAGWDEPIVVGFRRDGSLSVFFGPDPVYQFNAAGELRRAYSMGLLYKAERGRLVSLRRERGDAEVALVRTELTAQQSTGFLKVVRDHLGELAAALERGSFTITGEVPADADIVSRMKSWLTALPADIPIARAAGLRR
jgi:hypothetical protein